MIFQLIFVLMIVLNTFGDDTANLPSAEDYLSGIQQLIPTYNLINLFDGPSSVSNAKITSSIKVMQPSVEQMMYYNYYTSAVNCEFVTKDLSCFYCDMIKGDIKDYTVLNNVEFGTMALVALSEKRKEIVVAFRATENVMNAVLDAMVINATPDVTNQIRIHRGFYIAVCSLYDEVVKTVGALRLLDESYKAYKVVITGHSLGAGMARVTLFYLIYLNQFPGITYEIYTFGEPRSGNKYYADYLNSLNITTARITNRGDIICHLPPTTIFGTTIVSDRYYHVLNEYWIASDSSAKFAVQSSYEDQTCSNSLGPLYSAVDHLTYFDVNHVNCVDVYGYLAIPAILTPVPDLPPFPKKIQIQLSDVSELVSKLSSPVFGR